MEFSDYINKIVQDGGNKVAGRIKYLQSLSQPYEYQDAVDPSASMQVGNDYVRCPAYTILADSKRSRVHHTYVLDIETWGFQANKLHMGCLMSMRDNDDYTIFRSWHHTYEKIEKHHRNGRTTSEYAIKHYGGLELLEDTLFEKLCQSEEPIRIHTYAHGGSGHDWLSAAWNIHSNHRLAPDFSHLSKDRVDQLLVEAGVDFQAKRNLYPEARPFMMQGISSARPRFERKRKWIDPKTGKLKSYDVNWELKPLGNNACLIIHIGNSSMWLMDSMWLFSEGLASYGQKGDTPLQYTDPEQWLDQKIEEGELVLQGQNSREHQKQRMDFWFNYLTDEAVEYCVQDCRILSNVLKDFTKVVAEEFIDPHTNKPLFALAYPTAPQLAKVGQILSQTPPKKRMHGMLLMSEKGVWFYEKNPEAIKSFVTNPESPAVWLKNPFGQKGQAAVTENGWFCKGEYVTKWREVQFGGRAEVFKPRNSKGTRVIAFDKVNSFGEQMAFQRFLDPRRIKQLEDDLVGRDEILRHLENNSGMYYIRTKPSENSVIRNHYPVFPFRVGSEDYDSRLVFASWEGYFQRHVTGEELRYFLEEDGVEDDDIRVIAEKSYYAPLLEVGEAPFSTLSKKLYKRRVEARKNGDETKAKIIKRLMNAGGYGIHVQQNTHRYLICEYDTGTQTQDAIGRMIAMTPEWSGWLDLEKMSEDELKGKAIVELAQKWAAEHYRHAKRMDIDKGNTMGRSSFMQVSISLPDEQAPHAIRPWGCAIAAYGRIALHKALSSIKKADSRFEALYCDTDSIYFEVPEDMTDEEVIEKLESVMFMGKPRIKVGEYLGDWKIEAPEANTHLITEGADVDENGWIRKPQGVFLAPKHYYLFDKHYNILKDTVKTIPKNSPEMRCAMLGFFANNSKLGDPRGVHINIQMERNLINKIYAGTGVKRHYRSMTAPSRPITFINPSRSEVEGMTCIKYMQALGKQAKASPIGIRAAIDEYVDNCKIRGKSFWEVKASIEERMDKALEELAMTPTDLQHENLLVELMSKKGMFHPNDSIDGLPM